MAPPRGPVFSQGQTWLPQWLSFSPLHPCDTPSMFASYGKDSEISSFNGVAKAVLPSSFKDIANQSFPCLNLSDEGSTDPECNIGIEDHTLENKYNEDARADAKSKAFSLVLNLSQTQTEDVDLNCESAMVEEMINADNVSTSYENPGMTKNCKSQRASHVEKSIFVPEVSRTLERTSSPSIQSSISPSQHSQSHSKRAAELNIPVKGKKTKVRKLKYFNEDFQAAIRLTVASAETLVVADIMNECQVCQNLEPKSIIDAALALKRGRETSGLDSFTLEVPSYDKLCNLNLDSELDDTDLQGDYVSDLRICSQAESKHNDNCQEIKESPKDTELNSGTTAKVAEIISEIMRTSDPLKNDTAECDDRTLSQDGDVIEEQHHTGQVQNEGVSLHKFNMEPASHQHGHLPINAKGTYTSRWFGGWTTMDSRLEKKFQSKKPDEKHNKHLESATSDLSEPCDLAHHTQNRWRHLSKANCKGPLICVPQIPNETDKPGTVTAGSCAEILVTSSQASVKCSLQEPLCSFVPCSINAKQMPQLTVMAKDNGHQSNIDTDCNGTTTGSPLKHSELILQDKGLCKSQESKQHPPEFSSRNDITRIYSSSLKSYSTNHTSPLFEAGLLANEKPHSGKILDEKKIFCLQGKQIDNNIDMGCIVRDSDRSLDEQSRFILQESTMPDSPLTWHRGKRRRLRAYRMVESALTQDTCEDAIYDCLADDVPIDEEVSQKAAKSTINSTVGMVKVQRTGILGHNPRSSSVALPKLHKENSVLIKDRGDIENLENCEVEVNRDGQRETSGMNSCLFQGLNFLITGFPDKHKPVCEEICRKIQLHGGTLLSTVPVFSSSDSQKVPKINQGKTPHCIVIAPQKVRTLKYLYGCSVGSLFVRPSWIDECISRNDMPSLSSTKEKTTPNQIVFKAGRSKELIFSRIEAFIHGRHGYCTKLSLLIQHGGGRLCQSLKSLVQEKKRKIGVTQIVIAEHQSKLPGGLQKAAGRFRVSIVSGDWVIDSLLEGRLLPLSSTEKCSTDFKSMNLDSIGMVKRDISKNVSPTLKRLGTQRRGFLHTNHIQECEEGNKDNISVFFLGKGTFSPSFTRKGLSFGMPMAKVPTSKKLPKNFLYYKSVNLNSVIYSVGDFVEIQSQSKKEKEPYIAQIESFLGCYTGTVKTRSAGIESKAQSKKPGYLCCRWFYRPSDTGFPCMGTGNELYLSDHIDHEVPVDTIIKKVHVVLIMDDKCLMYGGEEGWKYVTEGSLCAEKTADYICKFFYDYQKESLHQLKVALTS